jgi:hypothetical protein
MFEQLFASNRYPPSSRCTTWWKGLPPDSSNFDAYLVTGSKADSFGDDPWIQTLKRYLLERYKRGDKLLGVCFGTSCWPCCSAARPSARGGLGRGHPCYRIAGARGWAVA